MNSQGWTPHQSPNQCIQKAQWFPPLVEAFPSLLLLRPASKEASDSCGVHLELLASHCSFSDGWEPDCCQNIHQATSLPHYHVPVPDICGCQGTKSEDSASAALCSWCLINILVKQLLQAYVLKCGHEEVMDNLAHIFQILP